MRILVAAMGSRGDVQPMLALAVALRRAGHDPVVCAPPDFEAWARELGIAFVASGASVEQVLQQHKEAVGANPVRLVRALRQIMLQCVPDMAERSLAAAEGVDAVVSANQFLARTVAEVRRVPLVGVFYQPTLVRSEHHPPLVGRWQTAPRWANRLSWRIAGAMATRVFIEPINVERAKLGLAAARDYHEHIFVGVPYLFAGDPVIAPAPPDWAGLDITTTGPWFYDDASPLPAEVEDFIDAGSPPVYAGFGSMVSEDAAATTRILFDGVLAAGRRLLLSKGWAGLGLETGSPAVKVVSGPMPHAKLFPRVAAVIHHGGAGTTAAALRAGVPQVLVPHALDQYYYAHRLAALGIAPPGIAVKKLGARRLARAIEQSLSLSPGPRLEAAERLRSADGLARAVASIEKRVGAGPKSVSDTISGAGDGAAAVRSRWR